MKFFQVCFLMMGCSALLEQSETPNGDEVLRTDVPSVNEEGAGDTKEFEHRQTEEIADVAQTSVDMSAADMVADADAIGHASAAGDDVAKVETENFNADFSQSGSFLDVVHDDDHEPAVAPRSYAGAVPSPDFEISPADPSKTSAEAALQVGANFMIGVNGGINAGINGGINAGINGGIDAGINGGASVGIVSPQILQVVSGDYSFDTPLAEGRWRRYETEITRLAQEARQESPIMKRVHPVVARNHLNALRLQAVALTQEWCPSTTADMPASFCNEILPVALTFIDENFCSDFDNFFKRQACNYETRQDLSAARLVVRGPKPFSLPAALSLQNTPPTVVYRIGA